MKNYILLIVLNIFFGCAMVEAQTAAFTYQGRLSDGAVTANGTYQMRFTLYSFATGGNQVTATLTNTNVSVVNGVFTVELNFPEPDAFGGNFRFLEIEVKKATDAGYTKLSPRQPLTSAPYAIRAQTALTAQTSNNSLLIEGIPASQLVKEGDTRLTDERTPLAGSTNYVQNTTNLQALTNFNISGTGTANIFNARTQFNLNGQRVLSAPGTNNLFVGRNSGTANTSGNTNTFIGENSGQSNTSGLNNTFFGFNSGFSNLNGMQNVFFGRNTGYANIDGLSNSIFGWDAGKLNNADRNSFFGWESGIENTSGTNNAFFGLSSGANNTTGVNNTFIGASAGYVNRTGSNNVFIGTRTGFSSSGGNNNTLVGYQANFNSSNLSYATAIGANSVVFTSNTIALGRSDGSDKVVIYGLGNGGSTELCRNGGNLISNCSSSLRYKTNIAPFSNGLSFVNQLRPVSFDWKESGMKDIGFVAEEVALIDPKFIVYNADGEVEGLKYDRLSVVFVNAFKEQEKQIEAQQKQIESQKLMIDALKKIVCANNPGADVCR
jgi:hypothetical protein